MFLYDDNINSILIFAAHQDDETIGCGGTIAKFVEEHKIVNVCFATDGSTGSSVFASKRKIKQDRQREAQAAKRILGYKQIYNLGLSCQKITNDQKTFHKFIKLIRNVRPDLILTHSRNDKHRDHKSVHDLTIEAAWKSSENIHPELGRPHFVKDVWSYEITDPLRNPDYVVDINSVFHKKMDALKMYKSQSTIIKDIESYVTGLSMVRGYSAGVMRGEAFKRESKIPVLLS